MRVQDTVTLIELIGGDPEAVLKSRHLSDYGPAPPSQIRRPSDTHVFSTLEIYLAMRDL
jgi:hypothetical protein